MRATIIAPTLAFVGSALAAAGASLREINLPLALLLTQIGLATVMVGYVIETRGP